MKLKLTESKDLVFLTDTGLSWPLVASRFFCATIFPRQKQTSACFKLSIDPNLYRQYIIGQN